MDSTSLFAIAAPMVNQSDLPFRVLVRRYGATLAFTQMLIPHRILDDRDYLEFHQKSLGTPGLDRPVVVQLCGNDPEVVVRAAKKVQSLCDGIDINLGCPQKAAEEGHYGAYLLGQKDWPIIENMVSALSNSLSVPVSAKIRLCQPAIKTPELGRRLEASGASFVTLHARHVSARRRRQGAADLEQVKKLKAHVGIPVISNGNVRSHADIENNRGLTGADGVMVGETLLGNPCIFSNIVPDPLDISLEYLNLCEDHPGTATLETIRTHIRHFVEFQCSRRPWYTKFRNQLGECSNVDEVRYLLEIKVQRWRGRSGSDEKNLDVLTM